MRVDEHAPTVAIAFARRLARSMRPLRSLRACARDLGAGEQRDGEHRTSHCERRDEL
jgi:hypothetical protein